jgi:two-component system, LuxR family, response regulator FixJ
MSHHRRVYVVAQDVEVRRLLTQNVAAVGAEAWPFKTSAEFLRMVQHLDPACVLVDLDLADGSGLDILNGMRDRGLDWPVIAMSGREDMDLAVQAMKLGALDFLRMIPSREMLALALASAWKALDKAVAAGAARRDAQERLARLTAREIDVSLALLAGGSNKTIAHEFGISVRTVEMHRAHVMTKLGVRSLPEAALLVTQAGVDLTRKLSALPKPSAGGLAEARFAANDCREQLAQLSRRMIA